MFFTFNPYEFYEYKNIVFLFILFKVFHIDLLSPLWRAQMSWFAPRPYRSYSLIKNMN